VCPLLRKLGIALLVVIKIEPGLGRLPRHFGVTALAGHQSGSVKSVRLIALVARATQLVLAKIGATPRGVLLFVAVGTIEDLVLVAKNPPCQLVVKALLLPFHGPPPHHVEAAALVLEVTIGASLAPYSRRSVKTLAGPNALFQVIVIVTVEALVAVDGFAVVDVAVVATALRVETRVLFCECARTRRKEVTLRPSISGSKKAQQHYDSCRDGCV